MDRKAIPSTSAERLAHELFDGSLADPAAEELVAWLAGSRPFRAFVEAHRDKIRKKLRGATDAEARRDVRTELRVAQLLLADRRMALEFEAYGSGKPGPDFTVAFRGERPFNLEVTRLRQAHGYGGLLAKLRQLPPSVPNAVIIAIDGDEAAAFDVDAATRALRALADARDDAFFASRGLDGARGFNQRYLRLGAVLVWCEGAAGEARTSLWTNRSARIALPERASRACVDCLRAG
jgi:hypothetical protein